MSFRLGLMQILMHSLLKFRVFIFVLKILTTVTVFSSEPLKFRSVLIKFDCSLISGICRVLTSLRFSTDNNNNNNYNNDLLPENTQV